MAELNQMCFARWPDVVSSEWWKFVCVWQNLAGHSQFGFLNEIRGHVGISCSLRGRLVVLLNCNAGLIGFSALRDSDAHVMVNCSSVECKLGEYDVIFA